MRNASRDAESVSESGTNQRIQPNADESSRKSKEYGDTATVSGMRREKDAPSNAAANTTSRAGNTRCHGRTPETRQ
jgi:hypothetical protein